MAVLSLAISGLLTIDMHSLNNEGAEGNYLLTRQVYITNSKGEIEAVNAISGDMFKHIQAEHLMRLAQEDGLPLCKGCKKFNANRISGDDDFSQSFPKDTLDNVILSKALETCIIDDAEGILITNEIGGKKRSIARKSVIEFGWIVGRPESTRTESYFHVKFVPEGRGTGSGEGANLGQNIFHRPASSGKYAVVLNADIFRLGRNDITLEHVLNEDDRRDRTKALLKSILFTFLKPTGAHRNTQHPHITGFEGWLTTSKSSFPAPTASSLNPNYGTEIEGISAALNRLKEDSVSAYRFDSLSGFSDIMENIISTFAR
ncbi:MAG: DevR family CRISPR-associated autoregulator [Peptococcaceae bacterium]|nr:MAG: DevR family CRISPR-associated autoregulator [Peptococcaceae bacterium]